MAGIVAMIAVSAMACQYALFRLALPGAVSTAVMTGNLSNSVLSLMDLLSKRHPLMTADRERLTRSIRLLVGFLFGCIIAAAAVCLFERVRQIAQHSGRGVERWRQRCQ